MPRPLLLLAFVVTALAAADARADTQRYSARLFGETVGEVRLSMASGREARTVTYRSRILVVRDRVRLRQEGFIQARFDRATGGLLHSTARRCTAPAEGGEAKCTGRVLTAADAKGAAPALAAELLLAAVPGDDSRCIDIVDEESGVRGRACATASRGDDGVLELVGSRLDAPFRARVHGGRLLLLELPDHGAVFEATDDEIVVSEEDLFADPIPASGDAPGALRRGRLRVRLNAPPAALARLRGLTAPGQRIVEDAPDAVVLEVARVTPPKGRKSRKVLDHAALLAAKAQGLHVDCQAATAWFLAQARARGWTVRPAVGFAWVDGRFAFHSWAVVETPDGAVPVDPLLAQVPADAGHVQLARPGESAGSLLAEFRGGLSLQVE